MVDRHKGRPGLVIRFECNGKLEEGCASLRVSAAFFSSDCLCFGSLSFLFATPFRRHSPHSHLHHAASFAKLFLSCPLFVLFRKPAYCKTSLGKEVTCLATLCANSGRASSFLLVLKTNALFSSCDPTFPPFLCLVFLYRRAL